MSSSWWSQRTSSRNGDPMLTNRPFSPDANVDAPPLDAAAYKCATATAILDYSLKIDNLGRVTEGVHKRVQHVSRAYAASPVGPPLLSKQPFTPASLERLGVLSGRIKDAQNDFEDAERIAADLEKPCSNPACPDCATPSYPRQSPAEIVTYSSLQFPRHKPAIAKPKRTSRPGFKRPRTATLTTHPSIKTHIRPFSSPF
jgi:hypothetical protein